MNLSFFFISSVTTTEVTNKNYKEKESSHGAIISKKIANSIKTNLSNAKSSLITEFHDMSPEVTSDIESIIKNSKVDRSKYRDLFFIKKRNVFNGDKEIISYDVKERIIPKELGISLLGSDFYVRVFLILIMLLLTSLVFATTLKVYQSIIKIRYLKKETIINDK